MNTKAWSAADRDEFHATCAEAWDQGEKQTERTIAFRNKVRDAVQARRTWAYKVEDEALHIGMASILKRWNKAHNQVPFAYDGKILAKPRTVGTKSADASGERFFQQKLLDFMSWEEIEAKREESLIQVRAYTQNAALLDRLLALRALAPAAKNPAEACTQIGTTLDNWLGDLAA